MYVPYRCCQKSFEDYYTHQSGAGGGLSYYSGSPYQKGYGIGAIFRSLFRTAVPLLKSGAKAIGKQLMSSGLHTLNDISRGDDVKTAVKRRMKEAGKQLTDKASDKLKNMIGSGKRKKSNNKRKRRVKKKFISRKSRKTSIHSDIFS